MKNNYIILYLFLIGLITFFSCKSQEKKENTPLPQKNEINEKQLYLDKLKSSYSRYSTFTSSFILKGKIDRQDHYFQGYLKATSSSAGDTLYIILKDTVFRSPVYSIYIAGNMVTQKDYLKNKIEKIPMSRYQWVVLFGDIFPFQFFYPIMRGYLPDDAYSENSKYVKKENKILYQSSYYDAAFIFDDSQALEKLFYKNKMNNDVLAFEFYGNVISKSKRQFPKTLYIRRQNSIDFLKITFFGARIQ